MNFTPRRASETLTIDKVNYPLVKDYMARDETTLSPDVTINKAIEIILSKKLTGVPVLDSERNIIGMITEKDCLKIIVDSAYNNLPYNYRKVSDYMSPVVKTVNVDSDILEVANEFLTTNFRKFPVVSNGKLVGQVSRRDILKAIRKIKSTTW
ncbi:MAG: CBS domain-containing protein [Bacteroidota bacterium]